MGSGTGFEIVDCFASAEAAHCRAGLVDGDAVGVSPDLSDAGGVSLALNGLSRPIWISLLCVQ